MLNGSKKYLGIYGLLVAIFAATLTAVSLLWAGGQKVGMVESQTGNNAIQITRLEGALVEKTSELKTNKLDKERFRQYTEWDTEVHREIAENLKVIRRDQTVQTADIAVIREKVSNLERAPE
jgi:hypothetical protein